MDILLKIGNLWVRRKAAPDPMALEAVSGLTPATVVTGASEGLGLALARLIAREGRTIVLLARSLDMLSDAEETLRAAYPRSLIIAEPLDVGQKDAPASLTRYWRATGSISTCSSTTQASALAAISLSSTRRSSTNSSRSTSRRSRG